MRIESKAHVGALSRSRPFHRLLEDVPECFDDLLLQQQAVDLARERARSARMVFDCTDEQTVQIESYLEGLRAQRRIFDKRLPDSTVYPGKHWEYANMVELNQEAPDHTQLDERASWFYEAIGGSAGMQGRIVGFGQVYLETSKDKNGNWLDGGKTYRLHVDADPPVGQFWSSTLYDNVTRYPLLTDQGAADMSSRKPDLVKNSDGSVDVYFGPQKPEGAANWIKTNPGKGWFPYFRFYAPQQAYFDKTWQLNDIEQLD